MNDWFKGVPQIVEENNVFLRRNPRGFRCYFCGYKFLVGDYWRFIYDNGDSSFAGKKSSANQGNFITCKSCDCSNIKEKWEQHCKDIDIKYWWLQRETDDANYFDVDPQDAWESYRDSFIQKDF